MKIINIPNSLIAIYNLKKMGIKKMAKKVAITKLWCCFVVIVILMSMSVSVFAMNDNNNTVGKLPR